jgi:hypothetical protein
VKNSYWTDIKSDTDRGIELITGEDNIWHRLRHVTWFAVLGIVLIVVKILFELGDNDSIQVWDKVLLMPHYLMVGAYYHFFVLLVPLLLIILFVVSLIYVLLNPRHYTVIIDYGDQSFLVKKASIKGKETDKIGFKKVEKLVLEKNEQPTQYEKEYTYNLKIQYDGKSLTIGSFQAYDKACEIVCKLREKLDVEFIEID